MMRDGKSSSMIDVYLLRKQSKKLLKINLRKILFPDKIQYSGSAR